MWGLIFHLILLAQAAGPGAPGETPITVHLDPAKPVQGQLLIVEVRGARGGSRVSGRFGELPLRFYLDEHHRVRALTAVELEAEPGPVEVEVQVLPPDGALITRTIQAQVQAGAFDEQKLRVKRKFVEPPKRFAARIARERAEMQQLWDAPPTRRRWRGNFVWPRRDVITSSFGLRRVFNDKSQTRHRGLDIDGPSGSPVEAIAAGRVVMVADRYYSGGTVVIDHGLRLFSLYIHLSKKRVREGQYVRRGQLIGEVGRTGRVTGPHLHLGTKVEGVSFDPVSLLDHDFAPPKPAAGETPGASAP